MGFAIKFAFDILAFTSVMVLIVLQAFGSYEFVEGVEFYPVALAALVLVCLGSRWLVRSQMGLVLAGMRQNEERLAFFGYWVQVFKALMFIVAGAVAGLSGALSGAGGNGVRRPGLAAFSSTLMVCRL